MKSFYSLVATFSVLFSLLSLGFDISRLYPVVSILGFAVFLVAIYALIKHDFKDNKTKTVKVLVFDFFVLLIYLSVLVYCILYWIGYTTSPLGLQILFLLASLLFFIRELSELKPNFGKKNINPAQLFILSFLFLVFLGFLLLLLPNATHNGIEPIDALFTATSAVCVTGLVVVDTGTHFTIFGQTVILTLIQLGGLGIMTFASYFSYFFRGGATYKNQLLLKDMTNTEKIGEVFSVFKKIIFITFFIEALGALFIYLSIYKTATNWNTAEQVFFSIFHSISGFCNAGFSTLSESLYAFDFRFNYSLHLVIAFLFIFGGLGFPIVFNTLKYLKYLFLSSFKLTTIKHKPWVLNLNSRIVLLTSLVLTVLGTVMFYILEYKNTLSEHEGFGKVVAAFFGAVTTRTAGFNSVDTASLGFSTLMLVLLLMWIGASPASTGGGIKTSTFAIATLNFISLAKGKERLELFRREISEITIRRAFAIISLSLVVIGGGVFLIATFDPEKGLLDIAFESFSAYSTVGLSLGITAALSTPSKLVIVFVMFIGRVSMLTILIALMKQVAYKNYQYPKENILIN